MRLFVFYFQLLFSASLLSQVSITTYGFKTPSNGAFLIHSIQTSPNSHVKFVSVSYLQNRDTLMIENVQAELLSIPTEQLTSLLVFDIDGDKDLDVFSVENHGETIRWHQNIGNEFAAHIIQSQTTEADRWTNMDLDADGDQDLLSVSFSNNSVTWFANDGLGNFSISDDEDTEVITIDTDQDGTADEIQMRYNDQSVSWFRTTEEQFAYNTTLWEFGNERWFLKSKLNLTNQENTHTISYHLDNKAYFNQPQTFVTHTLTTSDYKTRVRTLDMNLNQQKQVIFARISDDPNENLNTSQESLIIKPIFYPNPSQDQVFVQHTNDRLSEYILYDKRGRQVAKYTQTGAVHVLDVSELSTGIYFIKTRHQNQTTLFKLIKM